MKICKRHLRSRYEIEIPIFLFELEKITTKKPNPAAAEKLVASLLTWFKAPSARQKQYAQRLRYGLLHYNSRQPHTPSYVSEE